MRGVSGILRLLLFISLPVMAWAQPDPGAEPLTLEEQLQGLDESLQTFRDFHVRLENYPEVGENAKVYRRVKRGLAVLRELSRLAQRVAKLPQDDPQRKPMTKRLDDELASVIDLILAGTENLDQHIASVSAEIKSGDGSSSTIVQEANLYSLQKFRLQLYVSLGEIIDAQKALGLPVADEVKWLGDKLYIFAEALAGRLEYSGAALEGLRARLKSNPDNTELADVERTFAGEHAQNIERLAVITKLLARLELENAQYQRLLLDHGQTLSVSDFDSALLWQRLRDVWADLQVAAKDQAPDIVFRFFVFVLVLLIFIYLSRLARRAVILACERSGDNMSLLLKDMLASVSGAVVIAVGILMALSQVGISLAPMLAGLGVAGFIVGFALQDTLGNFAAGGMILIYRPYDVGDVVEVASVFGVVKKMSLVSTTIATFDNQTLVVPNSKIWGDVIKNVTAQKVRRVDLEFGIGYGDDIEKAEAILHDIVEQHELVLSSPEAIIKLHTLGDSSVNFVVRPWVKTKDYWDVYWDLTREVKMRFDREGVSIPFPQRDVHLYNAES